MNIETIPALSEVLIPLRITKCALKETVLLERAKNLVSIGLVGAKCLVKPHSKHPFMRLLNPTGVDITLSRNRIIAYVNVVENEQVFSLRT